VPSVKHRRGRSAFGRQIRLRAWCDPCGGARRGSSGRRACASADGSRAPCGGDGCSAGTYACSRLISVGHDEWCEVFGRAATTRRTERRMRRADSIRRIGSTSSRYAAGNTRVKPGPCGQPLDPSVPAGLAFGRPDLPLGRLHRTRSLARLRPQGCRTIVDLRFRRSTQGVVPVAGAAAATLGRHAQPVDKGVDPCAASVRWIRTS